MSAGTTTSVSGVDIVLKNSPSPNLSNNHFPSACYESNCIFIEMEKTADLYETLGSFLGTQFLKWGRLCPSFYCPHPSSEINYFPLITGQLVEYY